MMIAEVLTKKVNNPAAGFIANYVVIILGYSALTFLLFRMPIVSRLALSVVNNALMIPIILIFFIGLAISIVIFITTIKESKVVSALVADQQLVSGIKATLPLGKEMDNSLFIRHFRKFSTAENLDWSEEAKASLEGYLEEIVFKAPRQVDFFAEILPLFGLLGTALGLAQACIGKDSNAAMFVGVANAIGTTVFALYGKLIISSLNETVISERRSLLKTVLVIFRIANRRE